MIDEDVTDLELLVRVGSNCVDIKIGMIIGDNQMVEDLHRQTLTLVFTQAIRRNIYGENSIPEFLDLSGSYPEYFLTYLPESLVCPSLG